MSLKSLPLYQVDAFTAQPFAGNPAAVVLMDAPKPDEWMLGVAREMNLSETAFLLPEDNGFRLRWFTPAVEMNLCGHATLASAHVLFETGRLPAGDTARFHSRSGPLFARRVPDMSGGGSRIELDFPQKPPQPAATPIPLAAALDVHPLDSGRAGEYFMVVVEDEETVRSLRPDYAAIAATGIKEVIVTAPSRDPQFDFVSRFFAPLLGVNEDPVTGSAHCILGPYWAQKLGKTGLNARQVSPRGGEMRVRLEGERAYLLGQAVTVFQGELLA